MPVQLNTTKLATPGTCGCIFAAALLLPNQGQTNALDQPPHKRRGMALAKQPSLFFNVQNVQKKSTGICFILFCTKFSQSIFCQNILQYISPRYFAKISRKIFCQHIPKDILPKYSEIYFARISHQIFRQNIPQDILAKFCPQKQIHITCQNRHKDLGNNLHHPLLVHIKKSSRGDGFTRTITL